jgi:hypothetical protein
VTLSIEILSRQSLAPLFYDRFDPSTLHLGTSSYPIPNPTSIYLPICEKENMPPLHLRQEFPTLKAFKEALHAWAIEAHFEPRILKSDTGRVRVGCKRDPNCPFVVRCNWERKGNREPLARVTVLRDRHTCLNGLDWRAGGSGGVVGVARGGGMGVVNNAGMGGGMGGVGMAGQQVSQLEIRQDADGNIIPGARVLGPVDPRSSSRTADNLGTVPVLPKVQRNSASRLPFLMEILPRLMSVTKETTPVEIRECLLREYGAEVHLQQCRRAKTEILKKREMEVGESLDGMGSENNNNVGDEGNNTGIFGQEGVEVVGMNGGDNNVGENGENVNVNGTSFPLHTASGVVIPQVTSRREAALNAVGEAPVRCPYCINHRWMRSIKDAVEHMSMHVVV